MKPLPLEELDERASLQRRVDKKYLVGRDLFERVMTELDDDYQVLEIDGERSFGYESVYFDTSDLLCFRQHVENERPRFKTRSRLYAATRACVFEVKVKT
nr:VTC domain-containing protein [Actinomycetota bacterium]